MSEGPVLHCLSYMWSEVKCLQCDYLMSGMANDVRGFEVEWCPEM